MVHSVMEVPLSDLLNRDYCFLGVGGSENRRVSALIEYLVFVLLIAVALNQSSVLKFYLVTELLELLGFLHYDCRLFSV
jgi:hypothetical protein